MSTDLKLEKLSAQQRQKVLAYILFHLSEIVRGCYVEAGTTSDVSAKNLRAVNEIFQVISKQLIGEIKGENIPYPYEILFNILNESAKHGCIEEELNWALQEALTYI